MASGRARQNWIFISIFSLVFICISIWVSLYFFVFPVYLSDKQKFSGHQLKNSTIVWIKLKSQILVSVCIVMYFHLCLYLYTKQNKFSRPPLLSADQWHRAWKPAPDHVVKYDSCILYSSRSGSVHMCLFVFVCLYLCCICVVFFPPNRWSSLKGGVGVLARPTIYTESPFSDLQLVHP